MTSKDELAIKLVSQLPADTREAVQVLHYCTDLIENFLGEKDYLRSQQRRVSFG